MKNKTVTISLALLSSLVTLFVFMTGISSLNQLFDLFIKKFDIIIFSILIIPCFLIYIYFKFIYVEKSPIRPTVSLIYGFANQFVEDIDTFIKREGLQTERITTGSFKRIIKDLSEEELSLNTKYAIFFFVSDIKEFDKNNKVLYKPLPNLLIALGWFYKKFEQEKLLFLKDSKVTLPPCIEELKFISLDNISEAKEEIREHFKFEHEPEDKILIQSTENKYLLFSALFIVTFFIVTLILFYYLDK